MAGSQGSGPRPAPRRPVSSRRQSRTAARSPAVSSSREPAAAARAVVGSVPVAASRIRWFRRVGQAGSSPIPGTIAVGGLLEAGDRGGAEVGLGGQVQGVDVPGGRRAEPGRGCGEVAGEGGGGAGRVVPGEDVLEEVGGGGRVGVLGADDLVGVAVADDLQVDVVGERAAGEHRVELLSGLGPGGEAVHGVHGHALGGVDGGGVPELDRAGDVGGGEGDVEPGAGVPHRERTVGAGGVDGPAVAVLDPVGRRQAQSAVVGAGEDGVADIGGVPVGQGDAGAGVGAADAVGLRHSMCLCALVELGDEVAGGGEHDRVEALVAVAGPGGEHRIGDGGEVADVDAVVVEVEPEGFGASVAQGEGGGALGGVGEPHQLGQVQRAVGVGDVAQDAAGADGGELLVVADEPDLPAPVQDERDGGVEGEGVGHPGLVDDDQGPRPDLVGPLGQVAGGQGVDELGEGVRRRRRWTPAAPRRRRRTGRAR